VIYGDGGKKMIIAQIVWIMVMEVKKNFYGFL